MADVAGRYRDSALDRAPPAILCGGVFLRRSLRWFAIRGGCALLAFGAVPLRATPPDPAAAVILLANANDPDSLRIARNYAAKRGVPEANIIGLPLPLAETIAWSEFVITLWQPLQDELIRRHWIKAIPMNLFDAVGRRKFAPLGHGLTALVVCRGVPLRIAHDPALVAETPPLTNRAEFRTNQSAVDSELSLLAAGAYPINAFVANPLYLNPAPSGDDLAKVIKVSRLDAPSFAEANALVDQALAAERNGLLGRAYVDIGGAHPEGDRWLEAVAADIAALHFELTVDRAPATLATTARIDSPALYFGWYAGNLNGPFILPGFRFPTGAIALHIHSYSGQTLRSTASGWVGPLLARGVTATIGNVYEPYLELTHRPQVFFRALAVGATLVDAAYQALPVLSWQAILVGDPLYRPFARSAPDQADHLASLPPLLAGYAVIRQMRRLEAAGQTAAALSVGRKAQSLVPSLALGFALAQRLQAAGDLPGAASALGFAASLSNFPSDQWALAESAAQLLVASGRPSQGVAVYQALFATKPLPTELRLAWLGRAIEAARLAQQDLLARRWSDELFALNAAATSGESR